MGGYSIGNNPAYPLITGPIAWDLDGDGKAELLVTGNQPVTGTGGTIPPSPVAVQVGRVNPPGVHTW
jgi:hypothetical protein